MNNWTKPFWGFFLLPILFSCGIKANTKPLEMPKVELKRLGDIIYLRSLKGDVVVEGFEKREVGWVKRSPQNFCFEVKRLGEKTLILCVGMLLGLEPSVKVDYQEYKAEVRLEGFDSYELYADLEDPWSGRQIAQSFELERDYVERCYFVVGKKGQDYSKPVKFCLEPLPHPPIRDVERLEYRISGDTIYLLWSYEPDRFFKEFVILEGASEVGTTKGYIFALKKKNQEVLYKVKVRSIYGKESEGVEILYRP